MRTEILTLSMLGAVAMLVACSSSSTTPDDDAATAAKTEFWNAFGAADIDAVAQARNDMIAATAASPNDDELQRLIGMSYALSFSEGALSSNPPSPSALPSTLQSEESYLQDAVSVATDPYSKAMDTVLCSGFPELQGIQQNDPNALAQAHGMMDSVDAQYPFLGFFSRATIQTRAPASSPEFAAGLEFFFEYFEKCRGTALDRQNPDMSTPPAGPPPDPLCGNLAHVPHAIQGGMFLFADLLLKNNQPDAARPIYQAIKATDGYATWAFQSQVDQRLNSDLSQRVALYQNPNPAAPLTDQPGASPCLACHQR